MLVFLCYWPAGGNGFVWDDTALVLRDPLIRSWRLIPEGFRHHLFLDATGADFYRPLQRLSFTLDYALFGFAPRGWHFMSIAIHAAAAVALYALLVRWLGEERRRWAALAALVWAIHPVHTSAVTYIAGRADPLAALFGFSALALGLHSLSGERRAPLAVAGAAGCFLAAILSKESGSAFLAIWFLVLAWQRAPRRVWLMWLAVLAALLAVALTLRATAHRTPPPRNPPTPLAVRPILAARAVAEYAGLLIAPVNLRMERDVTTRPLPTPEATVRHAKRREWQTLLGVLLILGTGAWLRWVWKTSREAGVALLAALIAYLPISNLFALNATVAEHWLYVPAAFLFAALGGCAARCGAGALAVRCGAGAVLLAWCGWLAVRTWQRQPDWRDQRTFLERTIAAGGDSARMRINLGALELTEGRPEAALEEYRRALERDPASTFAWLGAAHAHLRLGHYEQARLALEKARTQAGLEAELEQFTGALDFAEKKTDPIPAFRRAAELEPLNWHYRRRLLIALAQTGRLEAAVQELRAFLQQQDFRADSWLLLAEFLQKAGRAELAAAAWREAQRRDVRLSPPI